MLKLLDAIIKRVLGSKLDRLIMAESRCLDSELF